MTRLGLLGPGLLLLWVGAACGGSGKESPQTTDAGDAEAFGGGATNDGANATDAMTAVDAQNGSIGDGQVTPLAVTLGASGNFVLLAMSGIATVPTSAVTGNLGVSPVAATYLTGFALTADSTNVFATSAQVTGKVYASDYAPPTPSNLTAAVGDMQLAFTDAAGRAPGVTELGAGNIGGMTITPGVYKWSSGLLIPTDVTLSGGPTDIWIFQIAQNLTVSNTTNITLAGGAVAKNIFWQVSGATNLGTGSHFEGVILCHTAITLQAGASIHGRLLAQKAVNIASSTVVEPAP